MNTENIVRPLQGQSPAGIGGAYPGQQPTDGLEVKLPPEVKSDPSKSMADLLKAADTGNRNFLSATEPSYPQIPAHRRIEHLNVDPRLTSHDSSSDSATPGNVPLLPEMEPSTDSTFMETESDSQSDDGSSSMEDGVGYGDAYTNTADQARAYLEAKGIEVDLEGSNGITALMVAAWEGEDPIVANLLKAGVPVNCVNAATGDNALILAASLGNAGVVNQLLEVRGIDLNKTNKNGDTALMLASSGKWPDVAESLLKHGAKADLVNPRRGYDALMLASAYGCAPIVELLLGTPSVKLNQTNPRGDTALILACAGKHREAAQVLLKAGARATTVGSQGHTALGMALEAKDGAIVELFIDLSLETVNDLNLFPDPRDAFSVTVTDLLAITNGSPQFASSEQPLDFFKALSGLVPADGNTGALVRWLRDQGLLTACAGEVASLLAPAHAWALQAGHGKTGGMEQQRLIYCISALGKIMATGASERVSKNYQNAGISEGGMSRLGQFAKEQLRDLENLAGEAAAQFGGDLVNSIIEHCFEQTNPKYELRANVLRDCLVREGFMEPIANVIASSWQSVLAQMQQEKINIKPDLSFVQTVNYIHEYFIKEAEIRLAKVLKENLAEWSLVTTVRALFLPRKDEAMDVLFETQCNWVSEFCAQTIKSN